MLLDQPDAGRGGQRPQLAAEDDVVGGRRGVDQHGVLQLGTRLAQHPHDGRDAAAGGDEQRLGRTGRGEHELAGRLVQLQHQAGASLAHEVVAHDAAGDRLDRDGQAAVGTRGRGQGVGAPLADALDVDADPDVLPGRVRAPAATGTDHQGDRVAGLGVHRLDASAQVGAVAQGVDQVDVVAGDERGGDQLGEPRHASAKASQDISGRCGCRHDSTLPSPGVDLSPAAGDSGARSCSEGMKSGRRPAHAPYRHRAGPGRAGGADAAGPAALRRGGHRAGDHRGGPGLRRRPDRGHGPEHRGRRADRAGRLPQPGRPGARVRRRHAAAARARGGVRAGARRGPQRAQHGGAAGRLPRRGPYVLARAVDRRRRRRAARRDRGAVRRAGLRLHRRAVGGQRGRAHRRAGHDGAGAAGLPRAPGHRAARGGAGRRGPGQRAAGRLAGARRPSRWSSCPPP